MFSLTIQGGVFLLTPYPVNQLVSLYPYIFNENMVLQVLSLQGGNLIRSAGLGLWRVRSLTEPTDRALRSVAAGVLGIDNQSSVGSVILRYVRSGRNFVSQHIVERVIEGIRVNVPSVSESVSSLGAGVSALGSGVSSALGSGVSSLGSGASALGSGVSALGSRLAGASEYLPEMPSVSSLGSGASALGSGVSSALGSGVSSLGSGASALGSRLAGASEYLPELPSLSGFSWRGKGGAMLNDKYTLTYNEVIPLTNKSFDLTMFDKELDSITFLNKKEKELFNNSRSAKIFNKLSFEMDKIITKQLNVIVKNDSIRVSIYLKAMEQFVNTIFVNIPTFKHGFNASLKPYSVVLKHDIQLIDPKVIFPELLNTDPLSPIYPSILPSKLNNRNTLKLNPSHIRRYLSNISKKRIK